MRLTFKGLLVDWSRLELVGSGSVGPEYQLNLDLRRLQSGSSELVEAVDIGAGD